MNARWIILRALLLALMALSPSAMRATPPTLSVSPCQIARAQIRTSAPMQRQKMREVAYSLPGQHRPASRLHRNRGKKISIERDLIAGPGCLPPCQYIFATTPVPLDGREGPNPSRGPPVLTL